MPPDAAHHRLAARQARTRKIRRTAVALAVTLFIATWAVIYTTLASGNDPALAKSSSKATSTTSSSPAPSTSSPSTDQTPATDQAPPVNTSQS